MSFDTGIVKRLGFQIHEGGYPNGERVDFLLTSYHVAKEYEVVKLSFGQEYSTTHEITGKFDVKPSKE